MFMCFGGTPKNQKKQPSKNKKVACPYDASTFLFAVFSLDDVFAWQWKLELRIILNSPKMELNELIEKSL
jgi:hypothetical protein